MPGSCSRPIILLWPPRDGSCYRTSPFFPSNPTHLLWTARLSIAYTPSHFWMLFDSHTYLRWQSHSLHSYRVKRWTCVPPARSLWRSLQLSVLPMDLPTLSDFSELT